jgi:hypothetical protein
MVDIPSQRLKKYEEMCAWRDKKTKEFDEILALDPDA